MTDENKINNKLKILLVKSYGHISDDLISDLVNDQDWQVRQALAENKKIKLPNMIVEKLLNDNHQMVRDSIKKTLEQQ